VFTIGVIALYVFGVLTARDAALFFIVIVLNMIYKEIEAIRFMIEWDMKKRYPKVYEMES
jgi:hypothetical protein